MFLLEILIVIAAYLVGSLSSAVLVAKKFNMPDPRSYGSGNPGASNVLRSGRKDAAAWTLAGDALKGLLAVWVARGFYAGIDSVSAGVVACAAVAVVLGHMYPVFFGFKGGKGVATAFGVLLGMSFWVSFWVLGIWLFIALKFKKSSLAALVAAACSPFVTFILLRDQHVPSWGWAIFLIAALIIYRHKDNIKRLCNGDESSIGNVAANYTPTATNNAAFSSAANNTQPETTTTSANNTEVAAQPVETIDIKEIEIDATQADLRDGDALEEAVIQAAQQAQNADAAPVELIQVETQTVDTETVHETQDVAAETLNQPNDLAVEPDAQTDTTADVAAPKKRTRKKAAKNETE